MKQRLLFFALMLFVAVGLMAAPAVNGNHRNIPVKKHLRTHSAMKKTTFVKATKAGEIILTENFAKFTEGSEASPDLTTDLGDCGDYISNSYTQMPDWWGFGVYQADGKAYLGIDCEEYLGFLETPQFAFNGETITISVKIKSTQSSDTIEVAWTDYNTDGEFQDGYYDIGKINNSWQTYTFTFDDVVGDIVCFSFTAYDYEVFIDDIEITVEEGTGGGGGGNGSAFFFEDCGTTAPNSGTRPAPTEYKGWKNYGVDNITFSGNADVRSTNTMSSHVWFASYPATSLPRTLEISGINTSDYKDVKLSFKMSFQGSTEITIRNTFTVSYVAGGETIPLSLPATTSGKDSWVTFSDLTGIPSATNVKLIFSSSQAENGFRLDDISLTGTPDDGEVANENLVAESSNKPSFFISGNNLSVRNVKLGSTIEIYNVAGQKVQSAKYFGGGSIHLGNLPKGVYIVRTADGFSTKILK